MKEMTNSLANHGGQAWHNGHIVPWNDIRLHATAHGLHYASAVFEGIKIYDGRPFQLSEHWERLFRSAERMFMPVPYSVPELTAATEAIIKHQNICNGYIRPIVWRGAGSLNLDPTLNPANIAIFAWAFEKLLPAYSRLILSEWKRPHPECGPWQIKATAHYMPGTLQNYRAKSNGYDDALFLDWEGNVADTTGTNIFLVIDGEICTPESNGFFLGITRQTVMDMATKLGFSVKQAKLSANVLCRAQEVFLTGSAAGIVAVKSIDLLTGSPISYKSAPPITARLQKAYQELIATGV